MKLLDVSKDQRYLYIHTDEGDRKQSLRWSGVEQLERKCRSLIGQEISHSTWGPWDKAVWFQDVAPVESPTELNTSLSHSKLPTGESFPLKKIWKTKSVKRIYGPPGTGKTTRLVSIAIDAIRGGMRPEDIGYFAFTNVAADEARDRIAREFNLQPSRFTNFSTLHSLTTRMGGHEGKDLCKKEHLQKFDSSIGIREEWLRAGDASSLVVRPDHPVLNQYSIMLNTKRQSPSFSRKSLETAQHKLMQYFGVHIQESEIENFAARYFNDYEEFKRSNNLADFNDVIFTVAKDSFPLEKIPTFELLIIDEAQDLSALQWDVVSKLSSKAKTTIIAGDDDQAIMEPLGAAPHLFNQFPTTEPDEVLPVSYRLPGAIKEFIEKHIVPRLQEGANRKQKEWSENPQALHHGEVIVAVDKTTDTTNQAKRIPLTVNHLLRIVQSTRNEEWLIMAPTRATCDMISRGLMALGVPHFCHRKDVLSTENRVQVQTIHTSKGMGSDNSALVSTSRGDAFLLRDIRLLYVALTRAKKSLYIVNQ